MLSEHRASIRHETRQIVIAACGVFVALAGLLIVVAMVAGAVAVGGGMGGAE